MRHASSLHRCVAALVLAAAVTVAMGQRVEAQEDVWALLRQEQTRPTTAENVRDRHTRLGQALGRLMQGADKPAINIDSIFSGQDENNVRQLLETGQTEQAAALVHLAILRLADAAPATGTSATSLSPARPPDQPIPSVRRPTPATTYDLHHLANGGSLDNMLKLMNPVIDAKRRRLYISGGKTTRIGVVDMEHDKLVETFDIGRTGGFLLYDEANDDLYLFDIAPRKYFRIDLPERTCVAIAGLPSHLAMPDPHAPPLSYRGITYRGGDGRRLSGVGCLQDLNACYGMLNGYNAAGQIVCQIKYGPDALYHVFDEPSGKLYASTTGNGSISIFDLETDGRRTKDIDVGTSAEQIVLTGADGSFFVRNRLGGSTILYHNPGTHVFAEIPNENVVADGGIGLWPTDMLYDGGQLYVLSHYGGRIDVVDPRTCQATHHIDLELSFKPRTDALSVMAMDRKRKILYASFPELGEIAAADASARRWTTTRKVANFTALTVGPAGIALCVDEKRNRLLAYMATERRLDLYDGLTLISSVNVDVGRHEQVMTIDDDKDILYLGNRMFNLSTMEETGRFSKGDRVIGLDKENGVTYLTSCLRVTDSTKHEFVYAFAGDRLVDAFALPPILDIPSSFAFDFAARKAYVALFESATVAVYDLGATQSTDPR